ncbi:MAG: hypothetical protein MJ229_07660 [bacterium]|nr:hypothetical protein [bacterium]
MKKGISLFLAMMFLSFNACYAVADSSQMEHLQQPEKVTKKSPTTLVKNDKVLKTVLEYNIIQVTFAEDFTSKNAKVGDEINFLLDEGLTTNEGTKLLPQGTKLVSEITGIQNPQSFNRSGKITIQFKNVVTPDGKVIPIKAKVFKKDFLSRGKLNALGKGMGSTLTGIAVGIGAGCGIGAAAGAVVAGGFAIGLPVGFAIGAVAGLVTPGLYYKAKAGDKLLIQLTDNLEISE